MNIILNAGPITSWLIWVGLTFIIIAVGFIGTKQKVK